MILLTWTLATAWSYFELHRRTRLNFIISVVLPFIVPVVILLIALQQSTDAVVDGVYWYRYWYQTTHFVVFAYFS